MDASKCSMAPQAAEAKAAYIADKAPHIAKRAKISLQEAEQIAASTCNLVLLPPIELEFTDPSLRGCTVGDVLAEPNKFKDKTLADPLEGVDYGRATAKVLLRRSDGMPWIKSFAHGGMS